MILGSAEHVILNFQILNPRKCSGQISFDVAAADRVLYVFVVVNGVDGDWRVFQDYGGAVRNVEGVWVVGVQVVNWLALPVKVHGGWRCKVGEAPTNWCKAHVLILGIGREIRLVGVVSNRWFSAVHFAGNVRVMVFDFFAHFFYDGYWITILLLGHHFTKSLFSRGIRV